MTISRFEHGRTSQMKVDVPQFKRKREDQVTADLGILALRLTCGGLMAGHGAQKLFSAFGGHGLEGTAGWIESLGLKPGTFWAAMAGSAEFGSGMLTALGLLSPIGPITMYGPMVTAWSTVHAGKPIWAMSGGAELPALYLGSATALALIGPGRFSLDNMLDIRIPAPLAALVAAGVAGGIVAGLMMRSDQPEPQESEAGSELQAGADRDGHPSETESELQQRTVGT
jgi:putative oxidoreductase